MIDSKDHCKLCGRSFLTTPNPLNARRSQQSSLLQRRVVRGRICAPCALTQVCSTPLIMRSGVPQLMSVLSAVYGWGEHG